MTRKGRVTDVPLFLGVGNKVSHIYSSNYGSAISQRRVLASHKTIFESVVQGAWELEDLPFGRCHFWSDPCVFGYIF